MNASVYIETSVIGYLTSWPQQDVTVAGHQNTTKLWWATAHARFELYVSQLVVRECSDGDADAVKERLNSLHDLPILSITPAAESLAASLIHRKAVPESQPNDALHRHRGQSRHRIPGIVEFQTHRERIASPRHRSRLSRDWKSAAGPLHARRTARGQ